MRTATIEALQRLSPHTVATGALKAALDHALPEMRAAAERICEHRVAVLLTHQSNAEDNGLWEWDEATGDWIRPKMDGKCVAAI
jgi:hypothetical protein